MNHTIPGTTQGTIQALPVLVVNPHNRCNCRCVMCDIWKRDTVQEISPEQFSRQLQSVERMGVEWVVFSGGEPLMHSDLFAMCEELRRRNIRVTVLSSGLLLSRHASRIAESIDDLILSLDGPPAIHNRIRQVPRAFELLAAGVARILEIRPDFPIAARCTVQRLNCAHLADAVTAARDLGLRSFSFLAADTQSQAFGRNGDAPEGIALQPADLEALEAQLEMVAARDRDFVVESPENLRRILRHFQSQLGIETQTAPLCNAPWTSAVVESDGTVRPCFFHPPLGRIDDDTDLAGVLNSPRAIDFRATLDVASNPICARCVCSLNWKGSRPVHPA